MSGERLKRVVRDGQEVWKLRCPGCDRWADLDDDQFHGRASVDHSIAFTTTGDERAELREMGTGERPIERGCGYHETHDWSQEVER